MSKKKYNATDGNSTRNVEESGLTSKKIIRLIAALFVILCAMAGGIAIGISLPDLSQTNHTSSEESPSLPKASNTSLLSNTSLPDTSVAAESTPNTSLPAEPAPAESLPDKSVPAKSPTAESVPTESVPAESVPAELVPAESAPAKEKSCVEDERIPFYPTIKGFEARSDHLPKCLQTCGNEGNTVAKRAGRIVGGDVADLNSWPFLVKLSLSFSGGEYLCGGTVLNNRNRSQIWYL